MLCFLTDDNKYEIIKRDILRGKSVPHYAAIEPDGKGLMIVSYKSFTFVHVGQDLKENQNENMSKKIKGNFTLHLHRAHMCLCTHTFMAALSLFFFICVRIVFCKMYYLNSMNCFN